jgi:hypothetical protein
VALSHPVSELRVNQARLPETLVKRDTPRLGDRELSSGAAAFETLESTVVRGAPEKPRIVSSAHGPLRHILLAYPSYAGGDDVYRAVFLDLFAKLPAKTELTIVTHPSAVADLRKAVDELRPRSRTTVVEAPDYLHFSVWAEDPYVVVEDVGASERKTFLLEPFAFPRYGDSVLADLVAEATPIQSTQAPLYFQGGNVLVGDDFVLIGIDYLLNTWNVFRQHQPVSGVPTDQSKVEAFVRDLFRRTFDPGRALHFIGTRLQVPEETTRPVTIEGEEWTEVVYAGTGTRQPIFHIDMFISLAGKAESGRYRVLVGSPAAADEILGREPLQHALDPIFDDVARNLKRLGFEVVRNPLPLVYVDDPGRRERFWYFATSNNCLVEIDGRRRSVWLPTYGHAPWPELAATDRANKELWEKLGFTVHQLTDFHPFVQNLGSVHCIKKYLSRSRRRSS